MRKDWKPTENTPLNRGLEINNTASAWRAAVEGAWGQ